MLEGELKSELNFSGSGRFVKFAKVRCRTLAEVRVGAVVLERQVRSRQRNVVHVVEHIEKLSAELNAVSFPDSPVLVDREIQILA